MRRSSLGIIALLAVSAGAGCQLVFRSATDADPTSGDGRDTDAPGCTIEAQFSTSLNQDTYITKIMDANFDGADAMQVNGPSTAALLEFRLDIDKATVMRRPRFRSITLTVPVAPLTACATACIADCVQTEGIIELELLKDSDWDEQTTTWTKRTSTTRWNPDGAASLPDNLGSIASAPSSLSDGAITFVVNPDQSDLLWNALSSGNEWSFRLSGRATARFAFADHNGKVCNTNVLPPSLKITYCE